MSTSALCTGTTEGNGYNLNETLERASEASGVVKSLMT